MGFVTISEPQIDGTPGKPQKALKPARSESTKGALYGVGAYGLWGLMPLYFILLIPANSIEIVANRVVWSVIFSPNA